MSKVLTAAATICAVSMFASTAMADWNGGRKHSPAKGLSYAKSHAGHHLHIKGGYGYGHVGVLAKSFQSHKVYKSKYGFGGASSAGNYLNLHFKGGIGVHYSGGAHASGGAIIISGGKKKNGGGCNGSCNPK